MKKLELNQMENLNGEGKVACAFGIAGCVVGVCAATATGIGWLGAAGLYCAWGATMAECLDL